MWPVTNGHQLRGGIHKETLAMFCANSCTLRVAIPSPPSHLPTLGEWEGEGAPTHKLPKDPCYISIGLSRIPLDNYAFSSCSRSVEVRNCHSD